MVVFELIICGLMLKNAYFSIPPTDSDSPPTGVVLGCAAINDQPSLMLANRLEQSLIYLTQYPEALGDYYWWRR